MYCPSCGKQISDNSRFCSHCGTSIAENKENEIPAKLEYQWFSWEWKSGQGGRYDLGVGKNEQLARLFFWNDVQSKVLPSLQKELDQGWQPVSEVGPSALVFQNHNNNWLELAAFKVMIRRARTSPLRDYEQALIGKWQRRQIESKGFGMKLLMGAVKESVFVSVFDFKDDNTFSGQAVDDKFSFSGSYRFTDSSHITLTLAPPGLRSTRAELTSNELLYHQADAIIIHYTKTR
jgi:hypothetical protein